MPVAPLNLKGLAAPAFTPMHADGLLDLSRVEQQAEHLLHQGVIGVFVGGTTGEGLSLTAAERCQLTERWCAVAGKRLPVIVHVGHNSIPDARELAAHAQKTGAAAIVAVPPFYLDLDNVQDVVACCAEVAAAAPKLPFYYYHIPCFTAVRIRASDLMEAAERSIPTLAGLKFSDGDLADFGECADRFGDRYDLFFGRDEMLLPALSVGAQAAIGTTYNFAAPLYRRMMDAFARGDVAAARKLQATSRDLIAVFQRHGGLAAMKAAMRLAGVDCGPCRLPLRTLDEREFDALRNALEAFVPVIRPEGPSGR